MTSTIDRPRTAPVPRQTPATPSLPPRRGNRFSEWFRAHRRTISWLTPLLFVSGLIQAINLGGSPARIDDEGTYTAQAWAINNLGELAHYTFWYDHPPLGWIQIAGWTGLTGGFQRYDIAVLAAREAMVVATLVSAALLWFLARRLNFSRPASAVAVLLFALSPLAVQFHRTVYLDNVATPWLLGAMLLALTRKNQLAGFAASAVAMGVAVLSKETYLLALPLVAWLMWRNARPETRRYTLSVAASILVLIGGSYILLALVKGELTPGADRTSLFSGIMFQLASRESSGSIFETGTLSNDTVSQWLQLDPTLSIVAPIAAIAAIFVKRLRPFGIALAAFVAIMFRPGGYLPVPYVIMLLPLAALVIAGVSDVAVRTWRERRGARRAPNAVWLVAMAAAVAVFIPTGAIQLRGLLLSDLDAPSRAAQSWVDDNVPRDSRLIVDDAMWVDFVNAGFARDNVIWFYKLDTDPAVQAQSPNGWADSDYVISTRSMITSPNAASAQSAIENSVVVASFGDGDQQVDVRRIYPEGAAAAATELSDELALRTSIGLDLSVNPELRTSAQNMSRFGAGQVDERISLLLGQLTTVGPVEVADLPIVPGEEGQIFRQVLISSVNGEPLVENGQLTTTGEDVEATLPGRYAPQSTEVRGDGLLMTFSVVAPGGLVS